MLHVKLKENVEGQDRISKNVSNLLQDIYSCVYGVSVDTKEHGSLRNEEQIHSREQFRTN